MFKFLQSLKLKKVNAYAKSINIEGGVITLLLCFFLLLLAGSILRVVTLGRNNYEIFNIEKAGLDELKNKYAQLQSELEYVNSDEYKQLFLRDSEGLTTANSELYKIKDKSIYYEEKKEYIKISDKKDFSDWWGGLITW